MSEQPNIFISKEILDDKKEKVEGEENELNLDKKKEGYRVMTAEDIQEYKNWVKKKISEWHDINPNVVLLTETSSVPFGWLLKHAWKETYTKEKIPRFLRCDIGAEGYRYADLVNENLIGQEIKQGYLKKQGIREDDKIMIYDESSQKPDRNEDRSLREHPKHIIINGNLSDKNLEETQSNTLERTSEILYKAGIKNLWTDMGKPKGQGFYLRDYHEQDDPEKKLYVKPTIKNHGVRFPELTNAQEKYLMKNYVGVLEKNPELRRRALDYIHDLKLVGREAGKELKKEIEEKK